MTDKLSDDPTPQEVLDHYDLHTSEGTANFSSDPAASLDLWHALAQALAANEALEVENAELRKKIQRFGTLAISYIKAYEDLAFALAEETT